MTRKRKGKVQVAETKPVVKRKFKRKGVLFTTLALVSIFFLVLFMNSYFNYTSGIMYNEEGTTIGTKYFLSGPDPYYNMRLCEQTLEKGYYPFVFPIEEDPLLNYPVGRGSARPPLFNIIAVASTLVVENFMPRMNALGWSMMFLPAIYGALLIFPIYGIGKELFNKKVGLLAALLVCLIPLHIGSGHGSALSLFDHDSFLLLVFVCCFYFVIKSLRADSTKQTVLYGCFAGLFAAAVEMTWVASQAIFILLTIYLIIQLFVDIIRNRLNVNNALTISTTLGIAFLVSLPFAMLQQSVFDYLFVTFAVSLFIVGIYVLLKKFNVSWIISLPTMFGFSALGLVFLYAVNKGMIAITGIIYNVSEIIFGAGIYGSKVALTIAEAHTMGISQTVMSFGPVVYWFALVGFIIFLYKTYVDNFRPESVFFIVIFIVNFWLTTTAGRFMNDLIPGIVVFSAFAIWIVIDKIDYKQMIKNVRGIGGFRGIWKGVRYTHICGISFIVFLVFIPNAFLTLDAATPPEMDEKVFGKGFSGAFGTSVGQQVYWADACFWLSQQDTEIELPKDRPAILTWWDYGFYLASMSRHPTVADNYQSGIPPAANFHTAQTEQEAVSVLIVRLCEGTKKPKYMVGELPENVKALFHKYLGNESYNLTKILENPEKNAPSFDQLIAPEYGNTVLRETGFNAMYHDATDILLTLSDYEITSLYHELMEETNLSIRYYGIEQRDMLGIFGVFPFLADKATHGWITSEDDFFVTKYVDRNTGVEYTVDEVNNLTQNDFVDMDLVPFTQRKSGFYNSMAYRTFYGVYYGDDKIPDNRIPTYGLKHFAPVYISPYISIAKYYEGVTVVGTAYVKEQPYFGSIVYVLDEYKIPHDAAVVNYDGTFSVVCPPGNISFMLLKNGQEVDLIEIDTPITEAEATWQVETNRSILFNVGVGSVSINLSGINETMTTLVLRATTYTYETFSETSITNGTYFFDNLAPDEYEILVANKTGFSLYSRMEFVNVGNNTFDIIME